MNMMEWSKTLLLSHPDMLHEVTKRSDIVLMLNKRIRKKVSQNRLSTAKCYRIEQSPQHATVKESTKK